MKKTITYDKKNIAYYIKNILLIVLVFFFFSRCNLNQKMHASKEAHSKTTSFYREIARVENGKDIGAKTIKNITKLILKHNTTEEQIDMCYALGYYFLKIKNYEVAYACYEKLWGLLLGAPKKNPNDLCVLTRKAVCDYYIGKSLEASNKGKSVSPGKEDYKKSLSDFQSLINKLAIQYNGDTVNRKLLSMAFNNFAVLDLILQDKGSWNEDLLRVRSMLRVSKLLYNDKNVDANFDLLLDDCNDCGRCGFNSTDCDKWNNCLDTCEFDFYKHMDNYNLDSAANFLNEKTNNFTKFENFECCCNDLDRNKSKDTVFPSCADDWSPEIKSFIEKIVKNDEIVVMLDISGSMKENLPRKDITKLQYSIAFIKCFLSYVKNINTENRISIGFITIGNGCGINTYKIKVGKDNYEQINIDLDNVIANDGTPLNQTLTEAVDLCTSDKAKSKAILLLTDGINTCSCPEMQNDNPITCFSCDIVKDFYKINNIKVYSVPFIEYIAENINDWAVFKCISEVSGGDIVTTSDYQQLPDDRCKSYYDFFKIDKVNIHKY